MTLAISPRVWDLRRRKSSWRKRSFDAIDKHCNGRTERHIHMQISVVIPAFNEEGNIGRLVEETFSAVPGDMLGE
ncbi:MAG: hypothetical protein VYD64_00350, partial [Pseudomonadota bacterium]|nr:hypothetical protein [Pseudomonadota bacterium]